MKRLQNLLEKKGHKWCSNEYTIKKLAVRDLEEICPETAKVVKLGDMDWSGVGLVGTMAPIIAFTIWIGVSKPAWYIGLIVGIIVYALGGLDLYLAIRKSDQVLEAFLAARQALTSEQKAEASQYFREVYEAALDCLESRGGDEMSWQAETRKEIRELQRTLQL